MNVFHAGDGNLHPLILYDANQPGELERTEQFGAEILKLSDRRRRTITGEQRGLRRRKNQCDVLPVQTAGARDFPRHHSGIRRTALLNPGKAVPTLHRCAEFGRHARACRAAEVFLTCQDSDKATCGEFNYKG